MEQESDTRDGQDEMPMRKSDIQMNPDKHIDQDFPGYPHQPSREKQITPQSDTEKLEANIDDSEGDNGSAGAFEATEQVGESDGN